MTDTGVINGSYYIRSNDIIHGLRLFKEYLPFGAGFLNTDVFVKTNTYNYGTTRGSTNGVISLMYTTGILGPLFYFFPFIKSIIYNYNKHNQDEFVSSLMIFIVFVISNCTEPVYHVPFMIGFLAYGYFLMIEKGNFQRKSLSKEDGKIKPYGYS